jgi:D-tyrosyl-tRNA(Tyr) deacylase
MISVLQRVKSASVFIDKQMISSIDSGYMILLGVAKNDTAADAKFLAKKIASFRIFPEGDKDMNRSITDVDGMVLVVSQFTLCADLRRGRRPGFTASAPPEIAEPLYLKFCDLLSEQEITVKKGRFGAMMDVSLINDGPVTFILNSREK